MTKEIKNEVVKTLQKTRGVRHLEFVSDNELKAVISNRNTALIDEFQKEYIDLKLKGMVDNYKQNEYGTEVFITLNEQICDDPKFTKEEKKHFDLDILEYAFYKKELEGTDPETLIGNTLKPAVILESIENILKYNENDSVDMNNTIKFVLENILKIYYYENGTYDYFTLYTTDFFKKQDENVDEYLEYVDDVITRVTNKAGKIKEDRHANLVLVVLGVALAQVLRTKDMSIFDKFRELI